MTNFTDQIYPRIHTPNNNKLFFIKIVLILLLYLGGWTKI